MARIFTEGFELGDSIFFDNPNIIMTTNPVRSGVYCARVNSNNSKSFSALSELYFRAAFLTLGNAGTIVSFRSDTAAIGQLSISSATRLWEVRVGTTLRATGSISNSANIWQLIEWHLKIDDTNGISEIRIDGIADASFSGDTKPSTQTTVDNFIFHYLTGSHSHFDDIALNDTTGGSDNSWCGDGRVILLSPNAAGDSTDLTPSAGSNYQCVDDIPPNSDTDYVEGSTAEDHDLYNLSASGLSGVEIKRVWAEARAKDTAASGAEVALVIKTNSSEYDSSNIALLADYTKQIKGTVHTVNPQTTSAWTISELDALQAGPKVK